jgi:hypothetical protein
MSSGEAWERGRCCLRSDLLERLITKDDIYFPCSSLHFHVLYRTYLHICVHSFQLDAPIVQCPSYGNKALESGVLYILLSLYVLSLIDEILGNSYIYPLFESNLLSTMSASPKSGPKIVGKNAQPKIKYFSS